MAKDGWNSKQIKKVPFSKAPSQKGKVNLQPEQIEALVQQQGVRIRVYRTAFCPNVKSIDSGEHEIDCKVCNGNNFVDRKPIETIGFIQSQGLEKIHEVNGFWDGNTVSITLSQGISLQYFTLVELMDFTEMFFERVKRQGGSIDRLKYSAECVHLLIDSDGKEYYKDVDFELTADTGDIKWKPNRGPSLDQIYSVNYDAAIQFRAIQAMHVARFGQITGKDGVEFRKLNEQWQMQKEYLVERTNHLGQPLPKNQIRDHGEE